MGNTELRAWTLISEVRLKHANEQSLSEVIQRSGCNDGVVCSLHCETGISGQVRSHASVQPAREASGSKRDAILARPSCRLEAAVLLLRKPRMSPFGDCEGRSPAACQEVASLGAESRRHAVLACSELCPVAGEVQIARTCSTWGRGRWWRGHWRKRASVCKGCERRRRSRNKVSSSHTKLQYGQAGDGTQKQHGRLCGVAMTGARHRLSPLGNGMLCWRHAVLARAFIHSSARYAYS